MAIFWLALRANTQHANESVEHVKEITEFIGPQKDKVH